MSKTLKQQARALLHSRALSGEELPQPQEFSDGDLTALLEEVRVAYIELELQNQELRESEQFRQRAERHYHRLFADSPSPMLLVDEHGAMLEYNRSAAKLLAIDEFKGHQHPRRTLMLYLQNPLFLNRMVRAVHQSETGIYRDEAKLTTAPGRSERTVEVHAFLHSDTETEGEHRSYGLMLHDFTDRITARQAELEREQEHAISEAKDQFLAAMSHELRTPLTSIIGNSEFLAESRLDPQQLGLVGSVCSSGRRLLSLVNDILDHSKIESGKFEIDYAPFDLQSMLAEVTEIFRITAADAGLDFQTRIALQPQRQLWGDGKRISQVVINLLSNAFKFTEYGAVTLHCERQESHLCLQIEDTGIGIEPAALQRLFTPFEQADGSISRRFGGTGLGLYISRSLVEMMGGEIRVESAVGAGSCFTVLLSYKESELPIRAGQPGSEPDAAVARLQQQYSGQVLLAEDTPELQQLQRKILERSGVSVTLAKDGVEVVEKALSSHYDLILMDMQMPRVDGLEATETLRQANCTVPIVALTANVMQQHREQFERVGAEGFLQKPIERDELQQVLSEYLQPLPFKELNSGEPETGAVDKGESGSEQRQRCRILAVDDEQSVLDLYQLLFSEVDTVDQEFPQLQQLLGQTPDKIECYPCALEMAESGEAAVDLVQQAQQQERPFQLALIDMRMPPGMDGLQTAERLRALDERIYIIIVSAWSDITPAEIERRLRYGVLYLHKPFEQAELLPMVQMMAENWNKDRQLEQVLQDSSRTLQQEVAQRLPHASAEEDELATTLISDDLRVLFIETTMQRRGELTAALEQQDWRSVKMIAHTIKGTAASFGYPQLEACSAAVQEAFDHGHLEQMEALGGELLSELNVVVGGDTVQHCQTGVSE